MLSLSETEIDLGLLEQAHAHFRSAKRIISHLRDYSESLASSLGHLRLSRRMTEVELRLRGSWQISIPKQGQTKGSRGSVQHA